MCSCAIKKEILANAERGMRGLSQQPKVASSPLLGRENQNLWITASQEWFLPHLRHVAIRQPPNWNFAVTTDAGMMTAWLATAALQGTNILDPDVREEAASMSLTRLTLVDLVGPPGLLVIRLGVKIARNVAMPEVFLEAITIRSHLGLPTWVWDQPDNPLREGHMCWSAYGVSVIEDWAKIEERQEVNRAEGRKPSTSTHTSANPSIGATGNIRDMFLPTNKGGAK
jgi:hypothetical protein